MVVCPVQDVEHPLISFRILNDVDMGFAVCFVGLPHMMIGGINFHRMLVCWQAIMVATKTDAS